jgi:hypothetical protein
VFLRTLVRELATSLEAVIGLQEASGYISLVGQSVGTQINDSYIRALGIDRLSREQVSETDAGSSMGQISTALRGIALRQGKSPGTVLGALGNFLDAYHPHLMATACYLVFDRRTRTLRYSKAGHPPPLLISADGTSRFLDRALGPPLGMIPEFQYHEAEITVGDGGTLLLYTDGLIERREEPLDVGLARLADLARDVTGFAVEDLCELVLHHQPIGEMPDDRALLAARFPAPAVLPAATAPPSPALQSREASSGV